MKSCLEMSFFICDLKDWLVCYCYCFCLFFQPCDLSWVRTKDGVVVEQRPAELRQRAETILQRSQSVSRAKRVREKNKTYIWHAKISQKKPSGKVSDPDFPVGGKGRPEKNGKKIEGKTGG